MYKYKFAFIVYRWGDVRMKVRPKALYVICGRGCRGKYVAKTASSAVAKFRREFQLTFNTDFETGGWKHISIDVKGVADATLIAPV